MGKSIRMQRDELVWETRVNYFTENDWNRAKGWMQDYLNQEGANDPYSWVGHQVIIYNLIKDLTFEEVLADFEEFENNYQSDKCIKVELTNKTVDGNTWTYTQFLHDLIVEWTREDNYDQEPIHYEYADDYQENIEIVEDLDKAPSDN